MTEVEKEFTLCFEYPLLSVLIVYRCGKIYDNQLVKHRTKFYCEICSNNVYKFEKLDEKYWMSIENSEKQTTEIICDDDELIDKKKIKELKEEYDAAIIKRDEILKRDQMNNQIYPNSKSLLSVIEMNDLLQEKEDEYNNMSENEINNRLIQIETILHSQYSTQAEIFTAIEEKKILLKRLNVKENK